MRVHPSDRISSAGNLGAAKGRNRRQRTRSVHQTAKGGPRLRRWVLGIVITLILGSLLTVLSLRWFDPPTTAFMLQSGYSAVRSEWTGWEQIGTALPKAVVASEDQNFMQHSGFDLEAIRAAISEHQQGEGRRGASTITQQVAKNLFLWPSKSLFRKGLEAYFTMALELLLSKQRILELYLNIAEFGPGVYGVGAASKIFFDTTPRYLSSHDAALFAAVLPNPKRLHMDRPSKYVRERQDWIIQQMQRVQIPATAHSSEMERQ